MAKEFIFIDDIKWEVSIRENTIKLKNDDLITAETLEAIIQVLHELTSKDGNPSIQSPFWELRQISYGKRAKTEENHLDQLFDSLANNSFVNGASHYRSCTQTLLKKTNSKKDFVTFIATAITR